MNQSEKASGMVNIPSRSKPAELPGRPPPPYWSAWMRPPVLVTVVGDRKVVPNRDFFPLTVNYQEKPTRPARFRVASSSARRGRAKRRH